MKQKMKNLVLLIPGLFDVPQKELEGLTPLEKANTPALDELAQLGQWIRVMPPKGGLEVALIELFGLESEKTHLSKSSLEIYAKELPFKPNQSSYLFKLASFFEGELVCDVALKREELKLFCDDLTSKFESWASFYPLSGSVGVAKLNEPFEGEFSEKLAKSPIMKERMNSLEQYLEEHPLNLVRRDFEEPVANGLHFYEGGGPLSAITSKRFYERFCYCSPKSYSKGLAYLLKMKWVEQNQKEGFGHFGELIQKAKEELYTHETVVLELHEILESTMKGSLLEKIKRIEYFDKYLIAPLMKMAKDYGVQIVLSPLKPSNLKKRALFDEATAWILFNPMHRKGIEPILALREKELNRIQGCFSIRSLAAQFLY